MAADGSDMMNEKPIIFSGEMVRAILDGRKTQTRRVIKPQPPAGTFWDGNSNLFCYPDSTIGIMRNCPYGAPGDLLWVRETWASVKELDNIKPKELLGSNNTLPLWYRADNHPRFEDEGIYFADCGKWRPSIFMPRWASRITLRVTDVRVERVQDIDKKSAIAEGIQWREAFPEGYTVGHDYDIRAYDAVISFKKLWDRINGKRGYGWDVNPWVWVVEFELVSPHPAPRNENTTSTSGRGDGEGGQ
jgi:hypothetical protein